MPGSQKTSIPFVDLEAQNGPLMAELRAAFDRVAGSNQFILGPEVEAFEEEIAEFLGAEYAIGVSSGSDALLLSLMALGIESNDEVITTPFSFFATVSAIVRLGAKPIFVDIDPLTYNLDLSKLEAAITHRTKAILPVHLFGQPCDLTSLHQIGTRHDLPIVEDAAQAIGAYFHDQKAGIVGQLGCFSFFPSKNLGAFGDGGLVTTQKFNLWNRIRSLRVHGAHPKYHHSMIGGNFRLDALQAALLRVKLPYLDHWTNERRKNAARYDSLFTEANLPPELLTTPKKVADGHIYNQYVIRTERRNAVQAFLRKQGIGCEVYYPVPLHLQSCLAYLGYQKGSMLEAERAAEQLLALPIFPELGKTRIEHIAAQIVAFLEN